MPWYRTEDGRGVFHACIRGRKGPPANCKADRLPTDEASYGENCGRMSGKLCDGPRGPWSELGSATCDRPICDRHATEVGPDRHLCPTCAAAARQRGVLVDGVTS